ncbi:MAG: hypothetical protein IT515_07180 [Burkholderiales bacterium]|nr:hypothetical protein [Burkholderiales bacterium]
MKPDPDEGALPRESMAAEMRRIAAAALVARVTALLRDRALTLQSIIWNDGRGAHAGCEWHAFRIASGGKSVMLHVRDQDLLRLAGDEPLERFFVDVDVRGAVDALARAKEAPPVAG